jgi:hypothetical protein
VLFCYLLGVVTLLAVVIVLTGRPWSCPLSGGGSPPLTPLADSLRGRLGQTLRGRAGGSHSPFLDNQAQSRSY